MIIALAAAVVRILTDDALAARLSRSARAWAGRFHWDAVADDVEALLEAAIAGDALPRRLQSSPFED